MGAGSGISTGTADNRQPQHLHENTLDSKAIHLEQSQSLHDGHALVALGNLGGASCGLLIVLNTPLLPLTYVWSWYGSFVLYTALSLLHRSRVRRQDLTEPAVQRHWLRFCVVGMLVLGLLWAALFVPVMLTAQEVFQFAVLAGGAMLGAGAMASLGVHLPSYRAVFLTMFPPIVIVLLLQQSWSSLGMGMAALLFLIFMLWSAQRFNSSYLESLRLNYENLALVNELRVQRDAAEVAGLAKSRFLAAASHDLRQPMYAINLYHGALANLPLSPEARGLLADAQQCASAMDGMFAILLDMSRLDAGVVQPAERAFAVSDMLERLRVEFTPMARDKGLELRVVRSRAVIRTDPALAERILRNYLTNAVRYTQRGGIVVGCRSQGDRVRVVVADSGIGIPEDKQSSVFEEYVQLGNPERDRTKGLGLGLAIVRRLGVLLNAPIGLRSSLGRGSAFWVDFERSSATDIAEREMPVSLGDLKGFWVVMIDDEGAIRDALNTLLRQWGCEVTAAGSGDEAIEMVAMSTRVPDAIVCDYRLRDGEYGLEAIEKLRMEFCEDIPALLVTGDTAPDRIVEIKSSGIPVLHKPLQPEALRQALLEIGRSEERA